LLRQRAEWLAFTISGTHDRDERAELNDRRRRAYELSRKLYPLKKEAR